MNNISCLKNCYGCGVCATICPKNIISMKLSSDGFYQPIIDDQDACIQCHLCLDVCSFIDTGKLNKNREIKSYSAYSINEKNRNTCSSGGVGFEIGSLLINEGYKACGVRYNTIENRAEHYISNSIKEFEASKGSKYIQSYTVDAFTEIKKNSKYVIFGAPCQIASLRRLINKKKMREDVVLVDFFCHGVPSYNLWKIYINTQKRKYSIQNINEVNFRDKINGWHNFTMKITGGNHNVFYSSVKENDYFYNLFFSDTCLNKACYSDCKFKTNNSYADIRIGDLWDKKYKNNNLGISGLLSFTKIGDEIIEKLKSCCEITPESNEIVLGGQMQKPPKENFLRRMFMKKLANNFSLSKEIFLLLFLLKWIRHFKSLSIKLIKFIKYEN